MSLTSILKAGAGEETRGRLSKNHLEFLEAVEQIELNLSSRLVDCGHDGKIEVPYRLSSSSTASKCGMAFDYLARLEVARYCGSDREDVLEDTVAGTGVGLLVNGFGYKNVEYGTISEIAGLYGKYVDGLGAGYIEGKNVDYEDVVGMAWFFSLLEEVYRSGRGPQSEEEAREWLRFHETDEFKEASGEIMEMMDVFRRVFLGTYVRKNSTVIYNPVFGAVSNLVGGADGDILIDGTLYDFKSSKKPGYDVSSYRQILCYRLMRDAQFALGDLKRSPATEIRRTGIYKTRYGIVEYLDMESLDGTDIEYAIGEIVRLSKNLPASGRRPGRRASLSICLEPGKGGEGLREGDFYVARREGCASDTFPREVDGKITGGKWMVFADSKNIDSVWGMIVGGVLGGTLGDLALCSVPKGDGKHVVLVPVPDHEDAANVEKTGRALMALLPDGFSSINFSAHDKNLKNGEGKPSLFTLYRNGKMHDKRAGGSVRRE